MVIFYSFSYISFVKQPIGFKVSLQTSGESDTKINVDD